MQSVGSLTVQNVVFLKTHWISHTVLPIISWFKQCQCTSSLNSGNFLHGLSRSEDSAIFVLIGEGPSVNKSITNQNSYSIFFFKKYIATLTEVLIHLKEKIKKQPITNCFPNFWFWGHSENI